MVVGGGVVVVGDVWLAVSKLDAPIRQARHGTPGLAPRCLGGILVSRCHGRGVRVWVPRTLLP